MFKQVSGLLRRYPLGTTRERIWVPVGSPRSRTLCYVSCFAVRGAFPEHQWQQVSSQSTVQNPFSQNSSPSHPDFTVVVSLFVTESHPQGSMRPSRSTTLYDPGFLSDYLPGSFCPGGLRVGTPTVDLFVVVRPRLDPSSNHRVDSSSLLSPSS